MYRCINPQCDHTVATAGVCISCASNGYEPRTQRVVPVGSKIDDSALVPIEDDDDE